MATTSLARIAILPEPPPAAAGFESVIRFWDSRNARWTAKLGPGDCYVTGADEVITTVLGSCIAACIRDPMLGIGGMNHFMLPESSGNAHDRWLDPKTGSATRYGSYAMESLINSLLRQGARRERLEVKLFGAGRMFRTRIDVGQRNIDFVRDYLRIEGLTPAAEDLGGVYPRRVVYFPGTGKARVLRLRPVEATAIADRERRYLNEVGSCAVGGGEVELFQPGPAPVVSMSVRRSR